MVNHGNKLLGQFLKSLSLVAFSTHLQKGLSNLIWIQCWPVNRKVELFWGTLQDPVQPDLLHDSMKINLVSSDNNMPFQFSLYCQLFSEDRKMMKRGRREEYIKYFFSWLWISGWACYKCSPWSMTCRLGKDWVGGRRSGRLSFPL